MPALLALAPGSRRRRPRAFCRPLPRAAAARRWRCDCASPCATAAPRMPLLGQKRAQPPSFLVPARVVLRGRLRREHLPGPRLALHEPCPPHAHVRSPRAAGVRDSHAGLRAALPATLQTAMRARGHGQAPRRHGAPQHPRPRQVGRQGGSGAPRRPSTAHARTRGARVRRGVWQRCFTYRPVRQAHCPPLGAASRLCATRRGQRRGPRGGLGVAQRAFAQGGPHASCARTRCWRLAAPFHL